MEFQKYFNEIKEEIIFIRRKIHENPELGFEEFETAKTIGAFLDKHHIAYQAGIAETGICAYIGSAEKGKTILLRADMDALPYEETTKLPFASKSKGKMHACGHDLHIANLLASAYVLKQNEAQLNGMIKLVFQPAEETTGGALNMIEAGILANPPVDICIGAHVNPSYPIGKIYFKDGALMASPDDFKLTFIGKSAHGAEPENGINPIEAGVEFVADIHKRLQRKIDFTNNVFSICSFQSGTANNIIPKTAEILGTFRSFSEQDRKNAAEILESLVKEICQKHHTTYELIYNFLYPPLITDAKVNALLRKCAADVCGKENIKEFEKPLMTGEDFAYFAREVPSGFLWAGCGVGDCTTTLHSGDFLADESVIEIVSAVFCKAVERYLKK